VVILKTRPNGNVLDEAVMKVAKIPQGISDLELIVGIASVVAALFAILAVVLTVIYRWWDSRTHLKLTLYEERDQVSDRFLALAQEMAFTLPPNRPSVFFKIHHKGRTAVELVDTSLSIGTDKVGWPTTHNLQLPIRIEPLSNRVFSVYMHEVGDILHHMGYTGKTTVVWSVRDTTGRTHTKKLKINDVEEWWGIMPAHGQRA
jgi:hypothetical protein